MFLICGHTLRGRGLGEGWANYSLGAKSSPLPVCENKVLLEPSHPHSFLYCLWILCTAMVELGSCHRDRVVHEARNNYCLAFYWKNLLTSGLEEKIFNLLM